MIAVAPYRQAISNNELLKKVVIAQTVFNIVVLIAFISLFPLKEVEYKLYEFSSSGQTFRRIDNAQDLVNRTHALVRHMTRQYVSKRETIDRLTDGVRVEQIKEQSGTSVFADFRKSYQKVDKSLNKSGTRKITIELDNPFNNDWSNGIHIVEFSTEDTLNSKKIIKRWKAVIGYELNEQKIRFDDLIQNPLGVEVVSYSITKRNAINKLEAVNGK